MTQINFAVIPYIQNAHQNLEHYHWELFYTLVVVVSQPHDGSWFILKCMESMSSCIVIMRPVSPILWPVTGQGQPFNKCDAGKKSQITDENELRR